MNLNEEEKYKRLSEYFDRKNMGDTSESNPEDKKLEYFWNECMPGEINADSIIARAHQKIDKQSENKRKLILFTRIASVAASVVLIFSVSFFLLTNKGTDEVTKLKSIAESVQEMPDNEVLLVTSKDQLVVNEDALIQYSKEGSVAINEDIIETHEPVAKAKKEDKEEYDQLIVPKGKRSRIRLSDGTLIWVNSQSKVVYPRTFKGNKRNIYVQGEVYLEVAHDKSRPFVVTANEFDLKVLGTKFNITNYSGDATNIVLVEGSVEVKDKQDKTVKLTPRDLLAIEDGAIIKQHKVDTYDYTSWIENIMVLKGDKLSTIIHKLELYFGTDIQCTTSLCDQKVYGKLDLKENLSEILESLQYTIPMEVQHTDYGYFLNGELNNELKN